MEGDNGGGAIALFAVLLACFFCFILVWGDEMGGPSQRRPIGYTEQYYCTDGVNTYICERFVYYDR